MGQQTMGGGPVDFFHSEFVIFAFQLQKEQNINLWDLFLFLLGR